MALSSVDFPAPLLPMRPITSPGMAVKSTPSTATRPPNCTVSLSVASTDPSALSDAGSSATSRCSDAGGAVTVLVVSAGPMRLSTHRSSESRT